MPVISTGRRATQAWLATALVLVAFTRPALAAPPDAATLRPQLEQLLAARVPANGPGVVVLVARGDTVLFRSARGMASVELGVPLSPEHVLRIASLTKQFAAATLLKLVDEGRAQLTDPLSKYLPDFPNGSHITLVQLLNHTSGVKSYTSIPGYMKNPARSDLSTAELVKTFSGLPVDFAPGAKYAYNNSGYVLVGAVIEAITKQTWQTQVAAMLKPLGITRTVFDDQDVVIPGMATGYSANAGGTLARAGLLSMTQPHAAGALVAPVDDLWKWNLALHRGQVLTPESYRRMTTPESGPAQEERYAYGLDTGTLRGQPVLAHTGGINGFTSMLLWLPQDQLTVVVLRNSDGPGVRPGALGREVAALALGQPYPNGPAVAVPAAQLQALAGVWRKPGDAAGVGAGDDRLLRVQDGVLTSQRGGGGVAKLRALGAGVFVFEGALHRLEVQPGGQTLHYIADGEEPPELWQRIGDLPTERATLTLTPAQQQALLGEYSSPQFSIKVFVDAQGVLRGQAPGQPALQLWAETPRRLFVKEVNARLVFEPAEPDTGPAQSATLEQGRTPLKLLRKTP